MPALAPVFHGVFRQIEQRLREHGLVAHRPYGAVQSALHCHAPRRRALLHLHGDNFGNVGEVHTIQFHARLPRVHARQRQQAADERGHLPRAQADIAQRLFPVFFIGDVGEGEVRLREYGGHGRAQFVRGVRGKAPFALKGALEAVEHVVKHPGEPVKLVARALQADALLQILSVDDALRRARDARDRPEGAAGDEVPAHAGGHHQRRKQRHKQRGAHIAQIGGGVGGDVAAQPDVLRVGEGHARVQHIPALAGALRSRADDIFLKGQVEAPLAVDEVARLRVERNAHAGQIVQIAVDLQLPVLHAHIVERQLRRADECLLVVVVHHPLGAPKQRPGGKQGNQRHQKRVPEGDARLDRQPLHASSRRT